MNSRDTAIWCENCGARWEMDEYGKLRRQNGEDVFTHVPDWYRWERQNVRDEVRAGRYRFEDTVRLEHLVNCQIGFRAIGNVLFTHDERGFTLSGKLDNGEDFFLNRSVPSLSSCHIEYDFHKKGITKRGFAIEVANLNDTYFVFPLNSGDHLTKIHFATEELFRFDREKKDAEKADRDD